MKHLRKGVNDYVMSCSSGSRELLFVSNDVHSKYTVHERHRQTSVPVDGAIFDMWAKVNVELPLSVFVQSMERLQSQATVALHFNTPKTHVTLLRFSAFEVIKWSPYLVNGATCFAPRCVGQLLSTDIIISSEAERATIKTANSKVAKKEVK